ncbi:VWA domain-containing protein [Reinekea sp. G2M2-21]|uniref:VWA domain-containing protein n=1 Tax=Reinekea sp. G2M2-21 TaxID=2788942 RepID=UPI0018AC7CEC|nr:VWA domain-containing protein [Reinekea sp. G2M2-21]
MMKLTTSSLFAAVLLVSCGAQSPIESDSTKQVTQVTPAPIAEEVQMDLMVSDAEYASSPAPMVQESMASSALAKTAPTGQRAANIILPTQPVLPVDENRENYADTVISKIQQVLVNPVSTFSTDVDTASYTNARRYLMGGQLPPADAVRVEEFINYFDYQLASPESIDEPIGIETELMPTPWNENTQLMRVSLQAYRSNMDDLPPLNLVFLLDVSGSMNAADKLPLMQRSFNLLVNQLRPQDHVAIAVYAGDSGVVLEPTSGDQKAQIMNAINNLRAGGSTHGSAGIHLAYQLAQQNFKTDSINRVILGTDGDFNVGTTNLDALKDLIENKRDTGVFLNVLGFGTGNYNDYLMEELSNHGNGSAYYIDSFQEARKIFAEQLTSTLQTVAKDVKIQVEFNPAQVAEYRLIGYDNRLLEREDFNNDKIDAGEMGAGHTVTALYEIVTTDSEFRFTDPLRYQDTASATKSNSQELAFVKVRYKKPNEQHSQLMSIPVTRLHNKTASNAMLLASAVAGFAEHLRNSPYLADWTYPPSQKAIEQSLAEDRWGYRQELLQLVKNAQAIE